MCKSHYNAARKYERILGQRPRANSVGATRRIRALIAVGYSQARLAQELGIAESYVSRLAHNTRPNVNADTIERVIMLYDRLSMTPGPSQSARDRALRKNWPPPLAWDEDAIDDPGARPETGPRTTVRWDERYLELRELGYSDFDIMRKLDIQARSLLRQLDRYGLTPSPEFVALATAQKRMRTPA